MPSSDVESPIIYWMLNGSQRGAALRLSSLIYARVVGHKCFVAEQMRELNTRYELPPESLSRKQVGLAWFFAFTDVPSFICVVSIDEHCLLIRISRPVVDFYIRLAGRKLLQM